MMLPLLKRSAFQVPVSTLWSLALCCTAAAQQNLKTYTENTWPSPGAPAVAWLPDVDGDGFGEAILGDYIDSTLSFAHGRVTVLSGKTGDILYNTLGPVSNTQLGWEVEAVGDTDGDGVCDYAAAAGGSGDGVWIFSGADGSILTQQPGFTTSVARAGDLDLDGLQDVFYGRPLGSGTAFVIRGGTFDTLLLLQEPFSQLIRFGYEVEGLGDIDDDGIPDLAVGAPASQFGCQEGWAGVFSGLDGSLLRQFQGEQSPDEFGKIMAAPGDLTGDGRGDLVIGAPSWGNTVLCNPSSFGLVMFVDAIGGTVLGRVEGNPYTGNQIASSLAPAGDIDGDGFGDILIRLLDASLMNQTTVWVINGATQEIIYKDPYPFPPDVSASYGNGLNQAADVDGDDFPDYLIGSAGGGSKSRLELVGGAPIGSGTFGAPCPAASGRMPRISLSGVPAIGTQPSIHMIQVNPGLPATLFLGISNTTWAGLPLPFDLGVVGMPGCDLLVSGETLAPAVTAPIALGEGRASFPLPIPNNPGLVGLSLFAQWFVGNPQGSQTPGAMTRGLQITFQ